jgi:hypothetical protein
MTPEQSLALVNIAATNGPVVTCEELAALLRPADNVAVLTILRDGEIQFVTAGRRAEDKAEAHQLKEWIKREVFAGKVPTARTHESFILDAAKVRQRLDEVRTFLDGLIGKVRDAAQNVRRLGATADNASSRFAADTFATDLSRLADGVEEQAIATRIATT